MGRRCGENTLGELVKGKEEWRDIENVRSVQQRGAEGLEVWDEVSHFNAKKLYLLKMRKRTDGKIKKDDLVATLKDSYKDECNLGSLDDPVLTGISDKDSEKAGDGVVVEGSD